MAKIIEFACLTYDKGRKNDNMIHMQSKSNMLISNECIFLYLYFIDKKLD